LKLSHFSNAPVGRAWQFFDLPDYEHTQTQNIPVGCLFNFCLNISTKSKKCCGQGHFRKGLLSNKPEIKNLTDFDLFSLDVPNVD
jgi:hypothetical protein